MMKWKEERAGSWTVKAGPLTIDAVKDHIHNPGFWSMHCPMLGMNTVDLRLPSSENASLAQGMAVNLVKSRLKELQAALSKV